MLIKTLLIILIIAAALAIGFILEARRERELRAWVAKRPGARLHWPFKPEEHPAVPAAELTELFISRAPTGWASAMEITLPDGEAWLIEFRTTPLGKKSSFWFTLIARRFTDATPLPDAKTRVLGSWAGQQCDGILTVSKLETHLQTPLIKP